MTPTTKNAPAGSGPGTEAAKTIISNTTTGDLRDQADLVKTLRSHGFGLTVRDTQIGTCWGLKRGAILVAGTIEEARGMCEPGEVPALFNEDTGEIVAFLKLRSAR